MNITRTVRILGVFLTITELPGNRSELILGIQESINNIRIEMRPFSLHLLWMR